MHHAILNNTSCTVCMERGHFHTTSSKTTSSNTASCWLSSLDINLTTGCTELPLISDLVLERLVCAWRHEEG
jgi:hypothetical protein